VQGELFVARGDPTCFLEPTDAVLDDVPLPIGRSVEGRLATRTVCAPGPLVLAFRDHRADMPATEQRAHTGEAVPLIARQAARAATRPPAGASPNSYGIEHGLHVAALMRLPGAERRAQRQPATVGDEVELRRVSAAAAAQGMIGRLARRVERLGIFPP